jgi:lipopolysaccharide export LptBFGC system permease protein LptF
MGKRMAKISIGHRAIRALFLGLGIGIFDSVPTYILTRALNTLAGVEVLSPIAMTLLVFGGTLFASLGIEWSKDIAETKAETAK